MCGCDVAFAMCADMPCPWQCYSQSTKWTFEDKPLALLVTVQVLLYGTCLRWKRTKSVGELFGSAVGKGLCVCLPVCAKFSTYPSSIIVAVDIKLLFNTDAAVASLTGRRRAAIMYWSFTLLCLCVPLLPTEQVPLASRVA